VWSIVIALAATRMRAAEVRCSDRDTPRQCARLLLKEWMAVIEADLATANHGVGSVSSPARSSSKDFLSVASAHHDSDQTLALTYTMRVARQQVQAEAVLDESKLRATLSFNPATRRLGRSIAPHVRLFESMLLAVITPAYGEDFGGIAWTSFDKPFDAIVDDRESRAEVIRGFEMTARSDFPPAAAKLVADFTTLLGNQPQLYASVLAGDEKTRAMLTWELGPRNLNSFRAAEGRSCEEGADCADALERYITRTAAAKQGRLSFSVASESAKFAYAAAYGRTFASPLNERDGRLDLTWTYDETRSAQTTVAATYTQKLSRRIRLPLSLVWSEHSESVPGACTTPLVSPSVEICDPPVTTTSRDFTVQIGLTYTIPPRVRERVRTHSRYCCG